MAANDNPDYLPIFGFAPIRFASTYPRIFKIAEEINKLFANRITPPEKISRFFIVFSIIMEPLIIEHGQKTLPDDECRKYISAMLKNDHRFKAHHLNDLYYDALKEAQPHHYAFRRYVATVYSWRYLVN
jgi:hypothetical protein